MKNYLLANFRLHNFKSLGYRKLANVHKSMQIRKPFVQKNKKIVSFTNFFGKITSPQTVFFPISNFCYNLTQPSVHTGLSYSTPSVVFCAKKGLKIMWHCYFKHRGRMTRGLYRVNKYSRLFPTSILTQLRIPPQWEVFCIIPFNSHSSELRLLRIPPQWEVFCSIPSNSHSSELILLRIPPQ